VIEVIHHRSFSQELRVDADPEIDPGFHAGRLFERRIHHVTHRARQYRAARDRNMVALLSRNRGSNLLADAAHMPEIEAAVHLARRADADSRHLRIGDRLIHAGRNRQPLHPHRLGDGLATVLLDNRGLATIDLIDLHLSGIHPDDRVFRLGQTPRLQHPYLPTPIIANLHWHIRRWRTRAVSRCSVLNDELPAPALRFWTSQSSYGWAEFAVADHYRIL